MTITTLPSLNRASATFKADTDTFFATQLPTFSTEINAEINRINNIAFGSYDTISSTSATIAAGTATFTVETGKGFAVGQAILIAYTVTPANYMVAQVTAYNSTTGVLDINAILAEGAGTYNDWTISVTAIVADTTTVGTVATGTEAPGGGTWLEVNGDVYLQSSYPELFSKVGLIPDNPDGINSWKFLNLGVAQTSVVWTGSLFASVGPGGTNGYTLGTDGTTSSATTLPSGSLRCMATNALTSGNITVAMSSSGTATGLSTDGGTTWVAGGTVSSGGYSKCIFDNSQFVGVGNNVLATTTNGVTWTNRTFPHNGNGVAHAGGGVWVAVLSNGSVVRSTDNAISWGSAATTALSVSYDIVKFNSRLFACGHVSNTGAIIVSEDNGVTWAVVSSAHGTALTNFAVCDGMLVAIGTTSVAYSVDGIKWNRLVTASSMGYNISNALAYHDGKLVAVNNATTNGISYLTTPLLNYDKTTQFTPGMSSVTPYKQFIKAL